MTQHSSCTLHNTGTVSYAVKAFPEASYQHNSRVEQCHAQFKKSYEALKSVSVTLNQLSEEKITSVEQILSMPVTSASAETALRYCHAYKDYKYFQKKLHNLCFRYQEEAFPLESLPKAAIYNKELRVLIESYNRNVSDILDRNQGNLKEIHTQIKELRAPLIKRLKKISSPNRIDNKLSLLSIQPVIFSAKWWDSNRTNAEDMLTSELLDWLHTADDNGLFINSFQKIQEDDGVHGQALNDFVRLCNSIVKNDSEYSPLFRKYDKLI